MAYGGDAIGRYDGKAIFVPGGIAGELVQVEVVEDQFDRVNIPLTRLFTRMIEATDDNSAAARVWIDRDRVESRCGAVV